MIEPGIALLQCLLAPVMEAHSVSRVLGSLFNGIPRHKQSFNSFPCRFGSLDIMGFHRRSRKIIVHFTITNNTEYGTGKECFGIAGPKIFSACSTKVFHCQYHIHKLFQFITSITATNHCHYKTFNKQLQPLDREASTAFFEYVY